MSERELFEAALELPCERRRAFLDDACGVDAVLRQRLEALLRKHDEAGSFLEASLLTCGVGADAAGGDRPAEHWAGSVLAGRYKLLEPIGEGGMGTVWLAQQTEPIRRLVAVKLIKAGMDSRAVLARFEAERQALALMDHPNVARVLDAGAAPNGRPYFVMELIKGVPITKDCDEHRLTPRQRLGLFISVCQAVQHAHTKGVIHRDLKPSNILVARHDGRPVPKVIDFGIAKATGQPLTEETVYTGFGAVVGTAEYMSPEQADFNRLDVDTRSDVYSLGVLLYELLTGSPPFSRRQLEKGGMLEMLRLIREQEPPRPSARLSTAADLPALAASRGTPPAQLARQVRGELDWIVMRCLEKDRARRYESASALAADLQRYLADEPVLACPPSRWYRLGKFARRNRTAVLTGSVVATAVVLAVAALAVSAGLTWQANQGLVQALGRERDALASERQVSYYRHVALAHREWLANNVGPAKQLLDACPPHLRHWEWHYLDRLCSADATACRRHQAAVLCLAFRPDGRRLASADADGFLKVWDVSSGREVFGLRAHTALIRGLAYSPDGRHLATASADRTVKVWEAETGKAVHTLRHDGPAAAVAYSPDGRHLVTGGVDRVVRVWDTTSWEVVRAHRGQAAAVRDVVFRPPDGKELASNGGDDRTIRVWDPMTGRNRLTIRRRSPGVWGLTYTPDGRHLFGLGMTGLQVWDATTGEERPTFQGPPRLVTGVAFRRDGRLCAAGGAGNTVLVWDATTGEEVRTYRGHTKLVHAVAFSPDGRRLASAGADHTVRFWEVGADQEARAVSAGSRFMQDVAFGQGGQVLALVKEAEVWKVWDLRAGRELLARVAVDRFARARLSPDGGRLAWVGPGHVVQVWDQAQGRQILLAGQPNESVFGLYFGPEGRHLAVNRKDDLRVWDLRTGRAVFAQAHAEDVGGVAFSPDGRWLGWSDRQGHLRVVDLASAGVERTFPGSPGEARCLTFSLDGRLIAWNRRDGSVAVAEVATGREVVTLGGLGHTVMALAFHPGGRRLASAGTDYAIRLWDLATGQEVLTLRRHQQAIHALVFSPDGHQLVSAARNREGLKVWDATPVGAPVAGTPLRTPEAAAD